MEGFGPDLYRWERDYFRDHFVRDVCGIELDPSFERELEAELSSLAERLSAAMPLFSRISYTGTSNPRT